MLVANLPEVVLYLVSRLEYVQKSGLYVETQDRRSLLINKDWDYDGFRRAHLASYLKVRRSGKPSGGPQVLQGLVVHAAD